MSNNRKDNINKNINNSDFTCNQCGKCCSSFLLVSQKEIARIKNYIGKNKIQCVNRNNITTEKFIDVCPFLNENHTCNIYEVRPEVCRWFRCDLSKEGNKHYLNHRDKEIVNMLTTFYPHAYCPEFSDLEKLKLEKMKRDYNEQKIRAYYKNTQNFKKI